MTKNEEIAQKYADQWFFGSGGREPGVGTVNLTILILRAIEESDRAAWKPVTEPPEKSAKYLCLHAYGFHVISFFAGQTFWNDGEAQDITHWRELPALP